MIHIAGRRIFIRLRLQWAPQAVCADLRLLAGEPRRGIRCLKVPLLRIDGTRPQLTASCIDVDAFFDAHGRWDAEATEFYLEEFGVVSACAFVGAIGGGIDGIRLTWHIKPESSFPSLRA